MINPLDGALRWMIEFLESHKNLAPENWKGMRDLDMKPQVPDFGMTRNDDGGGGMIEQDANPDASPDIGAIVEALSPKTQD